MAGEDNGPPPQPDFGSVAASGGGSTSSSGVPMLLLRRETALHSQVGPLAPNRFGVEPVVDIDTGGAHWYSLSDGERADWGERAYRAGLIQNPTDYSQAQAAWNAAVEQAAGFYSAGKKVTPWEALDIMAGVNGAGSGSKGFTGQRTQVDKSVEIPNITTVRAGLRDVFQKELGRAPSAEEIDRYSDMFIAAAKKNPVISRTTASFQDGVQTGSSTTRSGGVDLGELATEKAQDTSEWGAYAASTTYMNALLQAIGGTG